MNEEGRAFFVEDFFHEGDKIRIIAFDIVLFYQQLLNRLNQLLSEKLSIDKLLTTSPHEIGLSNYREAFCSIEEQECFGEFTVPYAENKEFLKVGFRDEFYSIKDNVLIPTTDVEYSSSGRKDVLYANTNPYVEKSINDFNFFFNHVEKDYEIKDVALNGNIYAAIVNVGFGNCCFIFDKNCTFAVDCSNHETCGRFYQKNIDAAIQWILKIQEKETFHIDVFFTIASSLRSLFWIV